MNITQAEQWKPIPGWEDLYEVSDQGRVRSLDRVVSYSNGAEHRHRGRVLKHSISEKGYHRVTLQRQGKLKYANVHSLVCAAFISPLAQGMQVRHADGNPGNNQLANLSYGTAKENNADKLLHGTAPRHLVESGVHHESVKTHCPRGHRLVDPNLVPNMKRQGKRSCLACNRTHSRIRRKPEQRGSFQIVSDRLYREIMR